MSYFSWSNLVFESVDSHAFPIRILISTSNTAAGYCNNTYKCYPSIVQREFTYIIFPSQPPLGSSNRAWTATWTPLWAFHKGQSLSPATGALEHKVEHLHEAPEHGFPECPCHDLSARRAKHSSNTGPVCPSNSVNRWSFQDYVKDRGNKKPSPLVSETTCRLLLAEPSSCAPCTGTRCVFANVFKLHG